MERKELELIADNLITEAHKKGLKGRTEGEKYEDAHKPQTKNTFILYNYVQYKNDLLNYLDKQAFASRIDEWKILYEEYLQILENELSNK